MLYVNPILSKVGCKACEAYNWEALPKKCFSRAPIFFGVNQHTRGTGARPCPNRRLLCRSLAPPPPGDGREHKGGGKLPIEAFGFGALAKKTAKVLPTESAG